MEINTPRPATPAAPQWSLAIGETSQVAEARRRTAALAREAGFDETRAGALAIVVTEIGNNLVKHAQRGQLIVRPVQRGSASGIELIALDRGPGMSDLAECFRDGYSSAGTSGTGLGAIKRQSDEFDVWSVMGKGTALVSRIWARTPPPPPEIDLQVGVVCLPIAGEPVSGDGWLVQPGKMPRVVVIDGLGHGVRAAEAAAVAASVATRHRDAALADVLERMHEALRATRGAVAAIAEIDLDRSVVRFAGVGNIAAQLWSPEKTVNMVSMNGTLGHAISRVNLFSYPWPAGGMLIAHSDGLTARWGFENYPGLPARDLSTIAALLYRDFSRGRDDTTVVVARPGVRR